MKVQGELVATLLILQSGAVSHLSLLCVGCAMGGSLLGNSQLFSLKKKKLHKLINLRALRCWYLQLIGLGEHKQE